MTCQIRILELRSVLGTGGGPEKTILSGAVQTDPARFAVTVCYIRDDRDREFHIDGRAATLGVDYVEVRERHSFDVTIWRKLCDLVRERAVHVVHSHDYKTDLLALLLGWRRNIVPLATVHGWDRTGPKERFLYYPAHRRLLRYFPRVIAVSSRLRERLVQAGVKASRIELVLNGIDPAIFTRHESRVAAARAAFGVAPDDLLVGAVGRLDAGKRFDLLLKAAAQLIRRGYKIKVLIAGEGDARTELEALTTDLGLSDTVRLPGLRTDVRDAYHAMDVFVQSSDSEGTPNVVLEAMAMEVPIVATDVGGTSDLATHGVHALLVPRRDVDALVEAIERTLTDPVSTRTRVVTARRRVEDELSFAARMRAVEAIYTRVAPALTPARSPHP